MIIKLSSSGKAVQVIDEQGRVFQTSKTFFEGLLSGKSRTGFVLMTKLPFKVNANRFAKSPTYNPETGEKCYEEDEEGSVDKELTNNNDSLSIKSTQQNKRKEAFKDKVVW